MIVIISDVHEKIIKLKRILDKYDQDTEFVLLGDFFDSWDGLTMQTVLTVKWLAENLKNPKYRFCWGNHDIHYAFPGTYGIDSPGFTKSKLEIIQDHLDDTHWRNFKLMHWIGSPANDEQRGNLVIPTEFLCSHAGIHQSLLHPFKGYGKETLEEMCDDAIWKLRYGQMITSLLACGRGRGGWARVGGVYWLDWNSEFAPIDGLNQIVGHSPDNEVRQKNTPSSTNYCLDTNLHHVIEVKGDGTLKVVKV